MHVTGFHKSVLDLFVSVVAVHVKNLAKPDCVLELENNAFESLWKISFSLSISQSIFERYLRVWVVTYYQVPCKELLIWMIFFYFRCVFNEYDS